MTPTILEKKEEVKEDSSIIPESSTVVEAGETIMPEIKGLDILKEGTYAIDIEKTISDMIAVIQKMEAQLKSVLKLNADLEKDLETSKEMILDLKADKSIFEDKIVRMEEEIPSKRELQIEIDHLINERSEAQVRIQEMKLKIDKIEKESVQHQKQIKVLREDKKDAVIETDYFESRLNAVIGKNKNYENEINAIRGENLSHIEKIKSLEEELKETFEEKYMLFKELKDANSEIKEVRSALNREKLKQ